MSKRLTSIDIAHIAGVSQTTVSLVLRNQWKGRVSKNVATQIIKICEENNYRTNHAARMLKSGHSKTLALVVPDNENPFFSQILHSLRNSANENGYVCLLIETDNNPNWYSFIEDSILGKEIDVAVVCYEDLPRRNASVDSHIIFLNDYFLYTNSIAIDFYQATQNSVRMLYDKGYRRMIHVRGSIVKATFTSRINAFNKTCDDLGIFHTEIISNSGYTNNDVYQQLMVAHENYSYPIAFFVDDDLLTYGIYRFAQEKHLTIGKDIGIISMDNTFLCRCFYPHLSSFGYDVNLLSSKIIAMVKNSQKQTVKTEHITIQMSINEGSSF